MFFAVISEVHTLLTLNKNLKAQSSSGWGCGGGLSKERTERLDGSGQQRGDAGQGRGGRGHRGIHRGGKRKK